MKFLLLLALACARSAARLKEKPHQTDVPKIHFLFLAVDKIHRPDIWQRFFLNAAESHYRVYVHCKDVAACKRRSLPRSWYIIPDPVETLYCENLVAAQIRLQEEALKHASARDRFALVSDSTLPVKNFDTMYAEMMKSTQSHFCVFPKKQWAIMELANTPICVDTSTDCDPSSTQCESNSVYVAGCKKSCRKCFTDFIGNPGSPSLYVMALKTHQWITLTQEDAQLSVKRWRSGFLRDFMGVFHMNWNDKYRNEGCFDEFWHFAALRGTFYANCAADQNPQCRDWASKGECSSNTTYMLQACPTSCGNCVPIRPPTRSFLDDLSFAGISGTQGSCDTYVKWDSSVSWQKENNPLDKSLSLQAEMSSKRYHPDTIVGISLKGISELRDSSFLFARKFSRDLLVKDACDNTVSDAFEFIISGTEMHPKAPGQLFYGVWLNTQKQDVSVMVDPNMEMAPEQQNSRFIVIKNDHDKQWNGVGSYCGEKVEVTFDNSVKAHAVLQDEGHTLVWSNGNKWTRNSGWKGEGTWETQGGTDDIITLRAYGGGSTIKLENLTDSSRSGQGYVDSQGRLDVHFNQAGDRIGIVSGQHLTWADGEVWNRTGQAPPCGCLPDSIQWSAPPKDRPKKCIWFEVTAAIAPDPARPDCEVVQIWPGRLGFAFMCDSNNWDIMGQPTVNLMRIIREYATAKDEVSLMLGKDFQYAWDILPCLSRSYTARLVDYLKLDAGLLTYPSQVYGTTEVEKQDILLRLRESGMRIEDGALAQHQQPISFLSKK